MHASIIQHVIGFLSGLLAAGVRIDLSQEYKSDFETFRNNYLSSDASYSLEDLKLNVLKTLLYARCAKESIAGKISAENAAKIAHCGINGTSEPMRDVKSELKNKAFFVGDRPSTLVKDALDNEPDGVLRTLYGMSSLD